MSTYRTRLYMVVSVMLLLAAAACVCDGSTTGSGGFEIPTQEDPIQSPDSSGAAGDGQLPMPEAPSMVEDMMELDEAEFGSATINDIIRASVQIIAVRNPQNISGSALFTGSGTIIQPTGIIATNCHVACPAPVIVISLTTDPDLPPQPTYIAEITHYDEDLDVAILQITRDLNGNPIDPNSLNLPFIDVGDSDSIQLGDPVRLFGYPSVGGATITFTAGSVSGFESANLPGLSEPERIIIKTDADIAGGNSGGTAVDSEGRLVGIPTAVNPEVRGGATIGAIGIMVPANLIAYVRGGPSQGAPSVTDAALPPSSEPDTNEPNDDYAQAVGPLNPGQTLQGYMSWNDDLDFFFISTGSSAPIDVSLTNIPGGTDYDLFLLDSNREIVASSEGTSGSEFIEYTGSPGTYFIVVSTYEGINLNSPYSLSVTYDSGTNAGDGIVVTGTALHSSTGSPIQGGFIGILEPGTSCDQFFGNANLNESLILTSSESDANGRFRLVGVPRGQTYSTFFIVGRDFVCEDNWLEVRTDDADFDLGEIDIFI